MSRASRALANAAPSRAETQQRANSNGSDKTDVVAAVVIATVVLGVALAIWQDDVVRGWLDAIGAWFGAL